MANRLMKQGDGEQVFPPKGDSPEQKAERQRFWIDHGNAKLVEAGLTHLHWVCIHGNYFIEERAEAHRRAMVANPNFARAA
jgi:hypothetical protein